MDKKQKIHNIVDSIVLAEPMRRLKQEFMVGIRGYLRSKPEDDRLLIEAEHAARQAMEDVLMEENPFRIPSLEPMVQKVTAFVKEKQGGKGFILTDVPSNDDIYDIEYNHEEGRADEFHVKAIRVKNGGLEIITDLHNVRYDEESVTNAPEDAWQSLQNSDYIYFVPTIFNIAENIWEYAG